VPLGYKRTEVGLIPEDWDIDRIDNHASIKTGSKNTQDRIEDGDYPFFVRSQQVERINTYSYEGEAVLTAGDGVGTGKVFHYINGRFDVHQRVYRISDFSDRLNGRYFFCQFKTRFYDRIMSMTAKSSVDSVRMEMIAGMQIPLPSLPEQRAIAAALSDADGLIGALDALIEKKRAIKQAAMQQLLTGKKRLPGFTGKWETKRLGDIITFLPTANNPRADLNDDGEIQYIHYGDVHAQTEPVLDCNVCVLPYIDRGKIGNAAYLEDGDLIMVDASEDLEGTGKSVEVQGISGKNVIAGLHTILCRGNSDQWARGFKACNRSGIPVSRSWYEGFSLECLPDGRDYRPSILPHR
jgi:type I restriction enzyme S subunit